MSYLPPCRQPFQTGVSPAVASASYVELPWVPAPFGASDDLLDLTVPTSPVVRQAGFYIVSGTIDVSLTDPTSGSVGVGVDLDYEGGDAQQANRRGLNSLAYSHMMFPFSLGYYIPAGGILHAQVNNDTDVDGSVGFTAYLVRLPV